MFFNMAFYIIYPEDFFLELCLIQVLLFYKPKYRYSLIFLLLILYCEF